MFIPEFVCGILATIGVEILLMIGYAIFRKKESDFRRQKQWENLFFATENPDRAKAVA